ncbi:hypothetical protein AB835_14530 [Candidatus Endobugula sertula]|uniref:Uncharacterized protein n=1 Tax=Candidatus Endobugula sertula TaxID=62101 RepID=A0A1D2QLC6_9GAMM|nr:hypothetical protein AB835_14530 [Candidatus Endobugula sertula]
MAKTAVFILLCFCAMFAAAAFGAVHNQISFTIGASYFYDVKFAQFAIEPMFHNRIGAALVGALASWWMGLLMGLPAFALGAVTQKGRRRFFYAGLRAIGVAITITAIGAFVGLAFGHIADINALVRYLPMIDAFSDPVGFVRAAIMHDASYAGGAIGALAALYVMWRAREGRSTQGEINATSD